MAHRDLAFDLFSSNLLHRLLVTPAIFRSICGFLNDFVLELGARSVQGAISNKKIPNTLVA